MLSPKRRTAVIATFAGLAVVLISISVWQQFGRASTTMPTLIEIDFTAYPKTDTILVSKGERIDIPIMVESRRDADYDLALSVRSDQPSFGPSNSASTGLTVDLSRKTVNLSPGDTVTSLGGNHVERDSGALLSVSAALDAIEGSYSYILEAAVESNGDRKGTGTIFTITVE